MTEQHRSSPARPRRSGASIVPVIGLAACAVLVAGGGVAGPGAPTAHAAPAAATATAATATADQLPVGARRALERTRFRSLVEARAVASTGLASPTASAGLPADGAFVRDTLGSVYRVAGRSLIYVSSWTPFGGPKSTVPLTRAMAAQVRPNPADGTFVTSIQERRVYRFVAGAPIVVTTWAAFGGKAQRTIPIDSNAILQAGRCRYTDETMKYCFVAPTPNDIDAYHDANDVLVLDRRPAVFVKSGQDARVYRIIGGAPVYVSSWTPFGGVKPTITVDGVAISRAGQPGPFSHLRYQPEDGTAIKDGATGHIFHVVTGAPVYVSHPAALNVTYSGVGAVRNIPGVVDGTAIARAGQPGAWSHLRFRPADGATLVSLPEGRSYVVNNGMPLESFEGIDNLFVEAWNGTRAVIAVGQATIDRAGQPGIWSHLRAPQP